MGPIFPRFLGAPRGARIGLIAWGLAFGKEFRKFVKICDAYQAAAIPCGLALLSAVWRAQKNQSRDQGGDRQENAHDLTTSAPAAIFGTCLQMQPSDLAVAMKLQYHIAFSPIDLNRYRLNFCFYTVTPMLRIQSSSYCSIEIWKFSDKM
ncbi:unnamed protein product [Amoebophrya sp. A120]|nr:unnamed protein product [Amoebophrya sp. A120]|eukprot:GSA120T00010733001.1